MHGAPGHLAVAAFAVALLAGGAVDAASGDQAPPTASPVVVELFTSQGCSSCPPADALLRRLVADPALAGAIAPLAFHVDYWDRLGWRDAFSQGAWSSRQRSYAGAVTSTRIYTPEAVVGGLVECVGSDERCLRAAIAELRARPRVASVELSLEPADSSGAEVRVGVTAAVDRRLPDGAADVVVALVESGLVTRVERGENADLDLPGDFVVRSLRTAFSLPAVEPGAQTHEIALPLAPGWRRDALSVTAFLQEPRSRRIRAAATVRLAPAAARAGGAP